MTRSPTHFSRPIWIVAAHLVLCAVARAALYFTRPADFESLGLLDVARAFGDGLAFDASLLAFGLAPVMFVLLVPFEWARNPRVRDAAGWFAFVHFALLALALTGNLIYFHDVGRHAGSEAIAMLDDPQLMLAILRNRYLGALLAAVLSIAVGAWFWRRALQWDRTRAPRLVPAWSTLAVIPVFLMCARGGLRGKPIHVVDAFDSGSIPRGQLELNGVFSMARSFFEAEGPTTDFLPWNEALECARELTVEDDALVLDDEYPLLRAATSKRGTSPNVVVLLLESWDANVVDSVRATRGLPPLGLTPHVDALARRGVLLSNCYAAGQRSAHGLLAVLSGLPTLPGFPYIGRGVELSQLSYLGRLAKDEGYRTLLMQGSSEHSFRVDSIAALAGFDRYAGKSAITEQLDVEPMGEWGAWDGDLLSAANHSLRDLPQPFAALAFTTSTHVPYMSPEDRPRPYPNDTEEHRFWNSVHYADSAIGEFVQTAQNDGWLENTVLVLIADHCSPFSAATSSGPARHHIFGLVVAPGLEPRVETAVTSQLDVLPTIIDLAGWNVSHATLGHSIFDPQTADTNGALCVSGDVVMRIEDDGWVQHDLTRRLNAVRWNPLANVELIERRLLSTVQVTAHALRHNRVHREQENVVTR